MNYTSIEQSKKLLELGLSLKSADMVYPAWTLNDTPTEDIVEIKTSDLEPNDVPCWSLSALLELMPIINNANPFITKTPDNEYCVIYATLTKEVYSTTMHSTSINATFEMICWLLENNYIKSEKV